MVMKIIHDPKFSNYATKQQQPFQYFTAIKLTPQNNEVYKILYIKYNQQFTT